MAEKLRLLLADDHVVLREGLIALINAQSDMEVIAEAGTGRETVAQVKRYSPDVALVDVSMPDMGGEEATELIRREALGTRIVVLTRHTDQGYMHRMFRAGASAYVLKRSAADSLISAIRAVAGGGTWVDPRLAGQLMSRLAGQGEPIPCGNGVSPGLSEREEQVLKLIAWGQSNKEVAGKLGLSTKTVECYKATALKKMNLRSRTDIVRHALAQGWLRDEQRPDERT